MKKIFASLLLVAAAATVIQAQNPRGKMRRQHPMAHQNLNFSEDQKQKMKSLNEDFRKNLMDLRKKDDITVKEWKSRMEGLHKKHREDIQGLLSKEQKGQMEKMKLERKQMAEINAKARMDKMKLRLDLNNEQAEKLNKQRTETRDKMKAIHENKSLGMEKKREEMKTLFQKRKETMKSILTEEQLKKIKEMKKHHPPKKGTLS